MGSVFCYLDELDSVVLQGNEVRIIGKDDGFATETVLQAGMAAFIRDRLNELLPLDPPRDVPVAEAEDSAREVDGEARSELDAEIQKVANIVWPSFPIRGEQLVTSLRNCFTIFAEGRRDG